MKRRPLSLLLLAALFLGSSNQPAFASAKSGATCTKLGQSQVIGAKKFTCTKSGRKLVWNKGTAITKPVIALNPADACKLPNGPAARSDIAIGWPRIASRMRTTGTLNAKVIMVDFPDAAATRTPEEVFALVNPGTSDIFKDVSYGKMTYSFDSKLKWYRMSHPSTYYSFRTFDDHRNYIQEAVKLAENEVDFSRTDSLVVLANPDETALTFGPAFSPGPLAGIFSKGNYIGNGATSAHDILFWGPMWLNHEISHTMGLVDLYAFDVDTSIPDNAFRFTGYFGYMAFSSSNSNAPGLFAWERWLLGWIDDSQIKCQLTGNGATVLTPIERIGGTKAVIVPTGKYTAAMIESRRAEGVDKNMVKQGVLVYTLDTSIASGYGPIRVQNVQPNDPRLKESPLSVGETLTIGKVTIKVSASDSLADTVDVTLAP